MEQRFLRIERALPRRNADARRDALGMEAQRRDAQAQFLRKARRRRKVVAGAEDDELLAAPAHERQARWQLVTDGRREARKHLVARLMAIRIIEPLEMVDVEHDEGKRLMQELRVMQGARKQRPEHRAAQAVRQRIVFLALTRLLDGQLERVCLLAELLLAHDELPQHREQERRKRKDAEWRNEEIHGQERPEEIGSITKPVGFE